MSRRSVATLCACASLFVAAQGFADEEPVPPAPTPPVSSRSAAFDAMQTAETILASQPEDLVDRLMEDHVIVLQEIREEGSLRGGLVSSYVIFDKPIERVYLLLSQSARQVEFRPELTSIETVEHGPSGPIDEQRLKILFQNYVYRLEYRLSPQSRRIEWRLDPRFDNDFDYLLGYWELYEMENGETLGRSGTSIDVGPAIPAFLQDWVTRKNIPSSMRRVRRWVNSDGEYRP